LGWPLRRTVAPLVIGAATLIPTLVALTNSSHGWFFGPGTNLVELGGHIYASYDRQPLCVPSRMITLTLAVGPFLLQDGF
jgi:hypothetical protein